MIIKHTVHLLLFIVISSLVACNNTEPFTTPQNIANENLLRQEVDFNFGWKFTKQKVHDAYRIELDDSKWQNVRLPHDWSIEQPYSQENTAGATGYLPGGVGWYRKHFKSPTSNGKTEILFDGVYNHSKVWINGHLLGERPYGYAAFHYDLTPYLNKNGGDNVIAVYVDRTRYIDSRWYTGSGIYRHVKLITTNKLHIPIWGTFITSEQVSTTHATVKVQTQINNDSAEQASISVITELIDAAGKHVAHHSTTAKIAAGSSTSITQNIAVNKPQLWDIDSPHLYSAKTSIVKNSHAIDIKTTSFGIRSLRNDANLGFFLNGKNIKIKGVNIHHDGGLVGAAVPKDVWERRLQRLKEAGVNAIRTAHNPPSDEFLTLCDEMGFLVQAEAFDEWDNPKDKRKNFNQSGEVDYITQSYSHYFSTWAERDIKAMVLRDRNHPSIIQWSIGNEIEWTYPRYTNAAGYWNKDNSEKHHYYWDLPPHSIQRMKETFDASPIKGPELSKSAEKLSRWVKELDTSRPVTANLVTPTVSHFSGYTDALDIIGYSYRQVLYDYGHQNYPDKMILGTENWVKWHEWQQVKDRAYIPGIFVWTGIDYLGESNGKWPKKGSSSGMLDFAGFTKPSYHMMKTLWSDEPHIHITTQTAEKSTYRLDTISQKVVEKIPGNWQRGKWGWRDVNEHWNYQNNEQVIVEVYSNVESVELLLNGESLGIQQLNNNPERVLKWAVPFSEGTLTARAVNTISKFESSITTAYQPHSILLTTDRTTLSSDGYEVAHVVAQLIDADGNPVKHVERDIQFHLQGNVKLLGVDNGAENNIQPHKSDHLFTHKGRALLIIQSNLHKDNIVITASSGKFTSNTLTLKVQP